METYRIRIVRNGHKIADEACKQVSDYAAIRRARAPAERSDDAEVSHAEVWRGSHCLFTGASHPCL